MTPREEELIAREMLERPELLGIRLKEKRWADVAALVRYVRHDVPADLAMTDPALFKTLRDQITLFHLRGGGALNLATLERLAADANALGGHETASATYGG
ncbi:MAG: hypothetical protein NTY17_05120 [Planctomycetia bacterium]|nr:hypothetical protein [Planctomycetia bacterium]